MSTKASNLLKSNRRLSVPGAKFIKMEEKKKSFEGVKIAPNRWRNGKRLFIWMSDIHNNVHNPVFGKRTIWELRLMNDLVKEKIPRPTLIFSPKRIFRAWGNKKESDLFLWKRGVLSKREKRTVYIHLKESLRNGK